MSRIVVLTPLLVVASAMLSGQISIGIRIGPPPPPRVVHVVPSRDAEAIWIEGYWYPVGNHYKWHDGYWTRPPYAVAHWVAPHYDGERFYEGYWEGDRGRMAHDHHWDKDRNRDHHDNGRGHDRNRH